MRSKAAPETPAPADVTSVLDSLRRTVRAFRAAAQVAEERLGISGAQHFALQQLVLGPAPSLNDLAARTLTNKSSLSVVVGRLVEGGYVRRTVSRADRRAVVLSLTVQGRRALERAPDSAQTRMIAALRRLSPGDLRAFAATFERFTEELGISTLEPALIFEDVAPQGRGRARKKPSRSPRRKRAR